MTGLANKVVFIKDKVGNSEEDSGLKNDDED
jgi:hypothetical protein